MARMSQSNSGHGECRDLLSLIETGGRRFSADANRSTQGIVRMESANERKLGEKKVIASKKSLNAKRIRPSATLLSSV